MLPEQQRVYYPLLSPLTDLVQLLLLLLQVDSFPLTAVESKLVFIYWENRKEDDQGEVVGGAADEQNSIY
jgi:hypothetical protein